MGILNKEKEMSWLSENYNYILGAIVFLLGVVSLFCVISIGREKKKEKKEMNRKEISLHTLFGGYLLVKIKDLGEQKVNSGGQSLLAYVYDAYGILNPTIVVREPDQDLTKNWRVIQFSYNDRILEVEKIK